MLTITARPPLTILLLIGAAGALSACAAAPPEQAALVIAPPAVTPAPPLVQTPPPPVEFVDTAPADRGIASWYRTGRHLHRTSSGELLDNNALTAASSSLPLGTMVRVGLVDDSRSVVVRVNDRMPRNHRLIDLSECAARELGMMGSGIATVTVTPIEVASAP